jgi:hypothetical protein
MVVVNQGTANDNKIFLCTTDTDATLGSTSITYTTITPQNVGTVTSITAGTGLSGGAITSSGTIAIDTATTVDKTTAQTLTNKTLTSPKINEDVAVTSTATELNILDGVTSTTAELNKLNALSRGSIIYGNASAVTTVLTKGTANQVLTSDGTDISWGDASSGRTGTVDWQTGSIKTGTFVPVNGEGYFVDTSSGVSTANLPAGSAGAIVSFADYTRTFQTNNLTITPNGSEKIGGVAANFVAQTEGQSITLVYVDATEGWINTAESTGQAGLLPTFITATGGTITTVCTNYKVHTFTGPGTFTVCSVGNPLGSSAVDYIVVAGGAGGGGGNAGSSIGAGGGGAGGYRESPGTVSGYTASPLGAAPATAITVTAQGYAVSIGGGGGGGSGGANGTNGTPTTALSIVSTGGGYGAGRLVGTQQGCSGGSGGGGAAGTVGGTGNTPPVSPSQGFPGSIASPGTPASSGSGGGAGATSNMSTNLEGTPGGNGVTSEITGSPVARAGGGGSGTASTNPAVGAGGAGGGGAGGGPSYSNPGTAATVNTGGGGGGATSSNNPPVSGGNGGNGGSGIVIIRYKFQ